MQEKNTAAPEQAQEPCYRDDMQLSVRSSGVAALAVACLIVLAASSAAAPHWVQASPSGGSIVALAQSPSEPVVLYAYAQPGGLFVSADGAATWHSRDLVLDDQNPNFLVSPDDAQTVYVQTAGSLLRTQDGGDHWSVIRPESQTVVGFALEAGDSRVLFAATPGGLYRSPDGGDTWELAALRRAGSCRGERSAELSAGLGALRGDRDRRPEPSGDDLAERRPRCDLGRRGDP